MIYRGAVERLVRRGLADFAAQAPPEHMARFFADDGLLVFPGDNPFAGEFRGREAVAGWFAKVYREFVPIRFEVHEVIVRGGPWRTRVCTRYTAHYALPDGTNLQNHGVQYLRLAWGKVELDRLYDDTEVVARAVERIAAARSGSPP